MADDYERLTKQIKRLLTPPENVADEHLGNTSDLRDEYFRERQKAGNPLLGWWLLFRDVLCGDAFSRIKRKGLEFWREPFHVRPFVDATRKNWDEEWKNAEAALKPSETPESAEIARRLAPQINAAYLEHYAWANELSIYYANLYRSSFVMNYLLGADGCCLAP